MKSGKKIIGAGLSFILTLLVVMTMNNFLQSDIKNEKALNIYNYDKEQYVYYMESIVENNKEIKDWKMKLEKITSKNDTYLLYTQNLNSCIRMNKYYKVLLRKHVESIRAYEYNNPEIEPYKISNEEEIMTWENKME